MSPDTNNKALCLQCRHYFVTWDPLMPHGCRAMGFKGRVLPCIEVRQASDMDCQSFEPKPGKSS
jgi:hypothetical protein